MRGVYDEAELYCAAFDFPVEAEVDWLLERIPQARSVLEPMCGNARYGRAFTERGLAYVGFDRSPSMLARATAGPGMSLREADARAFSFDEGPFDLAWCPIDSLRHLTEAEEIVGHLRCVARHLRAGGAYVVELDLMRVEAAGPLAPDDKSRWAETQPDGSVVEACVYAERCDLEARREWERSTYRRLRDGVVVAEASELHEMRMVTWDDWQALTAAGGFAVVEIYAHRSSRERPRVEGGPALEERGMNHYFVLRPA